MKQYNKIGGAERECELIIKRCVESILVAAMYPRLIVQVIVQIVNNDGGLLSAAVTAVGLALIDAGLPINDIMTSVTCAIDTNSDIIVDPTSLEEKVCNSIYWMQF